MWKIYEIVSLPEMKVLDVDERATPFDIRLFWYTYSLRWRSFRCYVRPIKLHRNLIKSISFVRCRIRTFHTVFTFPRSNEIIFHISPTFYILLVIIISENCSKCASRKEGEREREMQRFRANFDSIKLYFCLSRLSLVAFEQFREYLRSKL